jgi:uncharacterized protein YaeQ
VYETLDLRVAQHPSESLRFLVTRTLAYCLSYEEGIAFSKGGVSSTDEPPIAVWEAYGKMRAWIDVGSPAAERMNKATKLAPQVSIWTSTDLRALRASADAIHRASEIVVWRLDEKFLGAVEAALDRNTKLELTRNDQVLYVAIGGATLEVPLVPGTLI